MGKAMKEEGVLMILLVSSIHVLEPIVIARDSLQGR
jgi:hypothetical protein